MVAIKIIAQCSGNRGLSTASAPTQEQILWFATLYHLHEKIMRFLWQDTVAHTAWTILLNPKTLHGFSCSHDQAS
jgi:hypothetical protein